MRSMLLAVRNGLRSGLSYPDSNCDVTFDGHPHPRAGKFFVAVHPGSQQSSARHSLDESIDVMVTVSQRINEPFDRIGTDLLAKSSDGLLERVDDIRAYLHMSYAVMNAANVILSTDIVGDIYGFSEPLMYLGCDKPSMVGGEWFHAANASECAIVANLRFSGARRVQPTTNMR